MLLNEDGSLTRTPMSETWGKHKSHQLEKRHDSKPKKQGFLESNPSHLEPTDLDCSWSHEGEWCDVPSEPNGNGAEDTKIKVGRIEPYIDRDGTIKEAVGYGSDDGTLRIWYDLEEMKKAFPNWVIPNPPRYYNSRIFNNSVRRD